LPAARPLTFSNANLGYFSHDVGGFLLTNLATRDRYARARREIVWLVVIGSITSSVHETTVWWRTAAGAAI